MENRLFYPRSFFSHYLYLNIHHHLVINAFLELLGAVNSIDVAMGKCVNVFLPTFSHYTYCHICQIDSNILPAITIMILLGS